MMVYMYICTCMSLLNSPSTLHVYSHSDCTCTYYLSDELSQGLERSSQDEAAVEFTEVLLRYLMRTLLPYENLPLDDGFSQLPESTWFSISVSIMLVALLLRESSEQLQTEIVQSVVALRGACRAIQLAIEIGFTIEDEGVIIVAQLLLLTTLLCILLQGYLNLSCYLS